jgi:serine/threonine protein phosphatase PrpC
LEAAMTRTAPWRVGVASDAGLQRVNNEDRVFVDEAAGIFLVVDGIGGHAAGEHAAETAVRVISERLLKLDGSPERRVRESIVAANNEIYSLAQDHDEWRGMACVMTLALACDDRVVVGHVGDSRLYLIWDGKLRKLTSDHSPIGEREDQGQLSELDAMEHPLRHQVFRDVGSRPRGPGDDDFIEIRTFRFREGAAFLMCSDGLSDHVPSSEISAIIDAYAGDPEAVSRRLVNAANRAGGRDNVSVVFVAREEFAGSESAETRNRHAITRVRESYWKMVRSRALWMFGGILAGAALWAGLNRETQHPERAAVSPHRIVVSSKDPRAIANALSAAQPGDTIEVPPGEYLGPIELRDEINLISRSPGTAVIRADPAAMIDAGIAFAARRALHARLSGFRVIGTKDAPLSTGILLDGANLEIDEVEISGAGDCAVRAMAESASTIRASDLHDNPGCGVWIGGGSSPRLIGNRITRNGTVAAALRPGIEIHTPAAAVIERNIITGNGQPNLEGGIRRANIVDQEIR